MPKGYPNPKPEPVVEPDAPEVEQKPDEVVELVKHYCPVGKFTIIGHQRPAVVRKLAGGGEVEVSAEAFVRGEMAPAPFPGAVIAGKIWAGTRLALLRDEAMSIVRSGIAKREWAD